jgi:transposase
MAPLDFVPVVITDQASARAGAIEIEVAGARVRVSSGVDPALLADVLRTLKALG